MVVVRHPNAQIAADGGGASCGLRSFAGKSVSGLMVKSTAASGLQMPCRVRKKTVGVHDRNSAGERAFGELRPSNQLSILEEWIASEAVEMLISNGSACLISARLPRLNFCQIHALSGKRIHSVSTFSILGDRAKPANHP
jgi:hypothetical protein